MARELRFTNPAFRCEVVLSGTAMALYEAAHLQFERLKGIKSLGLMDYLHDIAIHTRHQQLAEVMPLFNKLYQQPKDKACLYFYGRFGAAAVSGRPDTLPSATTPRKRCFSPAVTN
jgi:hypothetical protein